MRLIYVNSSKVTKLEQKMNNSESFLLLLKNLLKCTYEVLLPSQRCTIFSCTFGHTKITRIVRGSGYSPVAHLLALYKYMFSIQAVTHGSLKLFLDGDTSHFNM